MNVSEAITLFLSECKYRNLSIHTQKAYKFDLELFDRQPSSESVKESLNAEKLVSWRAFLDRQNLAPSSVKRRIATTKVFAKWAVREAERVHYF